MNVMRTLLLIPLLTTMLLAQDGAADLFYKAFWLEQAAGKTDQAEALYREVVEKHAKAPEAPRALLGIIRIRAARGGDLDEFVAILERKYPDAKEQIEVARDLAAAQRAPFSPATRAGDSPVDIKIKMLYSQLMDERVDTEVQAFLADLGVRAHPMLAELLRALEHGPVRRATQILMVQRTPEAYALIEQALRDDKVLFRTAIVDTVAGQQRIPEPLAKAIVELFDGATPHLRAAIVKAVGKVVASRDPRVFEILHRAISDEDPQVRRQATSLASLHAALIPDDVAAALVARFEQGDPANGANWQVLFTLAQRPGLLARIEKVLVDGPYVRATQSLSADHPAYPLLARVVVARRAAGRTEGQKEHQYLNVKVLVDRSPEGVAVLLREAMERADWEVVRWAQDRSLRKKLAPYAAGLRSQAIGAVYSESEGRAKAAQQVLQLLQPEASDWPVVKTVLEEHKGKGIPPTLVQPEFVRELGVERALRLAGYAARPGDYYRLLEAGGGLLLQYGGEKSLPFFEAVVPHTEANSVRVLVSYAGNWPPLQPLIARHVIASTGEGWNWQTPDGYDKRRESSGRNVLSACDEAWSDQGARRALYKAAADPRKAVAHMAVKVAKDDPGDDATAAFAAALESPWADVRLEALSRLGDRGVGAPIARFLAREGLSAKERKYAFGALGATDAAYAPAARAFLERRDPDSHPAWDAYFDLAPEEAVNLALGEIGGEGPVGFRAGALRTLTKTSDPRRVAVFRRILRGELEGSVYTVLKTVADQYLIELGEETLLHLRSPDQNIRNMATGAVERLKFYAEARKAFKD